MKTNKDTLNIVLKNAGHITASDIVGVDELNHSFSPYNNPGSGWSAAKDNIEREEEVLNTVDGIEDDQVRYTEACELMLENLLAFEPGVSSAISALNAAGCFTVSSCAGHKEPSYSGSDTPMITFYLAPELVGILSELAKQAGVELEDASYGCVCVRDPKCGRKTMLGFAKAIVEARQRINAVGETRLVLPKAEYKRFIKTWSKSQGIS